MRAEGGGVSSHSCAVGAPMLRLRMRTMPPWWWVFYIYEMAQNEHGRDIEGWMKDFKYKVRFEYNASTDAC